MNGSRAIIALSLITLDIIILMLVNIAVAQTLITDCACVTALAQNNAQSLPPNCQIPNASTASSKPTSSYMDQMLSPNSSRSEGAREYQDENYEEALLLLTQAYDSSADTTILYYLGLTYYQLQNYKQAAPLLSEAVAHQPEDIELRYALAETLLGLKKIHPALKNARFMMTLTDKPDARIWLLYGKVLAANGKNTEAVRALKQALDETDPAHFQAVSVALIPLYQQLGNTDQAQNLARRAIQLNPGRI